MKEQQFIDILPISTERLSLRMTIVEDFDLLLKMDMDSKVQHFLGGIKDVDRNIRKEFFNKKILKNINHEIGMMTVCLKPFNAGIGFINLKFDNLDDKVELSYIFDSDYWKRGYCTEICKVIVDILFSKLYINEVYADSFSTNINSINVLERIGMKKINIHDELIRIGSGSTTDYFVKYSILNEIKI